MPKYEHIQPLSFDIRTDLPEIAVTYDRLALPDDYKQSLLREYSRLHPKAKNLPINDLNRLVRLLVPDLYTIDSYAGKTGKNWLRAEQGTVGIEGIRILLNEWSHAHGIGAVQLPDSANFQWEQATTDISSWTQYPNGTAQAADDATYDLLPALLAREIENQPFDFGGPNQLTFYRVSKSPKRKGQEMMSWPPLAYKDKKGAFWYYSYYLRIVVSLTPFVGRPNVNTYIGIRRWVSTYHKSLPREQLSVYLRAGVPYIKGVNSTHTFQVAPARLMQPGNVLGWDDKLPGILKNVGFTDDIPEPEMIRLNPAPLLESMSMPNMALVHNTRMGSPDHEVNLGVAPLDRVKLLGVLSDKWSKWLTLKSSLPQASVGSSAKQRAFNNAEVDDKEKSISRRWARLRQQHHGSAIRIEIYYQRPQSSAAMLDILGELMNITPDPREYERDFVRLTVATYELGDLGAPLNRSQSDSLQDVARERYEKVMASLGEIEVPTVALIELGSENQFVSTVFKKGEKVVRKSTDPKDALRAAFAHTGRLSQFFTIMTEREKAQYLKDPSFSQEFDEDASSLPDRFRSAVLDGLRQLGIHEGGEALERGRWKLNSWAYSVAGFWLIRQSPKNSQSNQQRFLPALVYIDGETGQVLAWVAGMNEMLPYHEVLLRAGQGKIDVHDTLDTVSRRLPQDLEDRLSGQDVVLAVDATQANMRGKLWNWLQDSKIEADRVNFNYNRSWLPEDKPKLRIVRVRNAEDEVPTWFAVDETDGSTKYGISKGLWQVSDRVFGSTVGTATTQRYKRNITKTDTKNAAISTPNPSFYEMTAAFLQRGDDAAEIVSMIHNLRSASIQARDETGHTLALHLAQRIEEYLLWVEEEDDHDEEATE